MERRKSWEINNMIGMMEGNPMGRSKSRESNPVVRMVSCSNILRINILPS